MTKKEHLGDGGKWLTEVKRLPLPAPEFNGVHVPARVFQLLLSGELSGDQLAILLMVEGRVNVDPKIGGCTRTDDELGEDVFLDAAEVSSHIDYMVEKGIMARYHRNGIRHLESFWSRPRGFKYPSE